MDDHGELDPAEQALEHAKRILDGLTPEKVRQLFRDNGGLAVAISTLVELADSEDPTVREDARAVLERCGLG